MKSSTSRIWNAWTWNTRVIPPNLVPPSVRVGGTGASLRRSATGGASAGLPVASAVGFLLGAFSVLIVSLQPSNPGPRSSPPRALRHWCPWLCKLLFVDRGGAPGRDRTPEERLAWNG